MLCWKKKTISLSQLDFCFHFITWHASVLSIKHLETSGITRGINVQVNENKQYERKEEITHLNLLYTDFLFFFRATITLSSPATSFSPFSASRFIPLPLTNNSHFLFILLSPAAFKEFSINFLLWESTNCLTPSLFRSHSLISLSKFSSILSRLCSFCFNKKALYLLWDWATDLIKLGVMVTSVAQTLSILRWSFTTRRAIMDNSVMLSFKTPLFRLKPLSTLAWPWFSTKNEQ